MENIDLKTLYTILHLLGVVMGMGGAIYADITFMRAIKNRMVSEDELGTLKVISSCVWLGLLLIVVSGALLFSTDVERYSESTKFLAKMSIVLVIILNGLFFHFAHLPFLSRFKGRVYTNSKEFMKRVPILVVSGAVSVTSWVFALLLGALSSLSYSYLTIMVVYGIALVIALLVGQSMRTRIFGRKTTLNL